MFMRHVVKHRRTALNLFVQSVNHTVRLNSIDYRNGHFYWAAAKLQVEMGLLQAALLL